MRRSGGSTGSTTTVAQPDSNGYIHRYTRSKQSDSAGPCVQADIAACYDSPTRPGLAMVGWCYLNPVLRTHDAS
jgi:hypothetical protein